MRKIVKERAWLERSRQVSLSRSLQFGGALRFLHTKFNFVECPARVEL